MVHDELFRMASDQRDKAMDVVKQSIEIIKDHKQQYKEIVQQASEFADIAQQAIKERDQALVQCHTMRELLERTTHVLESYQEALNAIFQHHPNVIGTANIGRCKVCGTATNSGSITICKKCAWKMDMNVLKESK
jgi:rubrerythrin